MNTDIALNNRSTINVKSQMVQTTDHAISSYTSIVNKMINTQASLVKSGNAPASDMMDLYKMIARSTVAVTIAIGLPTCVFAVYLLCKKC